MTGSVEDSWDRIDGWLRRHAPAIWQWLGPPATDADINQVEEAHGVTLPPDLAAWWRGANGLRCGLNSDAYIIPNGYRPASTARAVDDVKLGLEIAAGMAREDPEYDGHIAEVAADPAGSPSDMWAHLPTWVSFTTGSDGLFVDCREGDLHGCVMRRFHEGGQTGPLWPSVAAMWAETAEILEAIEPASPPPPPQTSIGEWGIGSAWWKPVTERPS